MTQGPVEFAGTFNVWHIENSINLPTALNRDLETSFDKHSKQYHVILCYGGDRSSRMAHYLRQVYGTTVIRSVEKGVFALRLQKTGHEPYYVRQVAPVLANHWVSHGLARHHEQSSIWVRSSRCGAGSIVAIVCSQNLECATCCVLKR